MYLTEDQAKEKWCPMALAPLRDHPEGMFNIAVNREWKWTDGESPQSSANCIGSTCMMRPSSKTVLGEFETNNLWPRRPTRKRE